MIINISNNTLKYLSVLADDYSNSIRNDSPDFFLLYYLNLAAHINALYPVINGLGVNSRSKVLEVGSGIGVRCMLIKGICGCDVTGVEPHPDTYRALNNCILEMLETNQHLQYRALNCGGEYTGLKSGEYDCVLSFEVLEHVNDPKKVLAETYRLLKPGGKAYFSTCNYSSFYEGHYRIFWNPFISIEENRKRIVKKHHNPKFLDELNFITKKQLVEYVADAGFNEITFSPHYTVGEMPELIVRYPDNFRMPICESANATFLQRFIQKTSVHKILSLFNREYKIYFELLK